jgi:hypothetical protein
VCAEVVANRDQIRKREIGQRIGQLIEIDLDAHMPRIRRVVPLLSGSLPKLRSMTRWPCLAVAVTVLVSCLPAPKAAAQPIPTPAHIVIVVEENHSSANVLGNKAAPFMNQLAAAGALMTQSYAEAHPSEPNYLALFSGSTFGLNSDAR